MAPVLKPEKGIAIYTGNDVSWISYPIAVRKGACAWLLEHILPENVSYFQIKTSLLLFFVLFGDALTLTMVFSYLPRLVKDFGVDDVHIGNYAGVVASSLFFGKVIGSYFWGNLADRLGRKTVLIISSVLLSVFTLLFGFTLNFWWVTCMRLMQGIVNGMVITAKAALGDISNGTSQSVLMGIVLGAYDLGRVIGPALGGFLVLPHEQYPTLFSKDWLFAKYPYLLPSLINFSWIIVGTLLTYFCLTETRKRTLSELSESNPLIGERCVSPPRSVPAMENNPQTSCALNSSVDNLRNHKYLCQSGTFSVYSLSLGVGDSVLPDSRRPVSDVAFKQLGSKVSRNQFLTVQPKQRRRCPAWFFACFRRKGKGSFAEVLKLTEFRHCVLLYGILCFLAVSYNELLPIFATTARRYRGLSFTTANIGTVLLAQSIPSIVCMTFLGPKIEVRCGLRKLFVLGIYLFAFGIPLIPCISLLTNPALLWPILLVVVTICRSATSFAFLAINVMINNAVEPRLFGIANGIGFLSANLFTTLAPIVTGSLYSWSLQNVDLGFPWHHHFVFLLLSFLSVASLVILVNIPKSIDKCKVCT